MVLHVLPTRTASAAENMAIDFLLLQRYPEPLVPRFRHYAWREPAFTFGYSQKLEFVRAQLPPDEKFDLCRRPTGGGMVDHRDDWTYALVIPRGHALEDMRAAQSYRAVHEALAETLIALGVDATLKPCDASDASSAGEEACAPQSGRASSAKAPAEPAAVCFARPEVFDVVRANDGGKIAGAAQKRNKHGLLFQGSIARAALSAVFDWDEFETGFAERLAGALGATPQAVPWPDFNEDEVSGLTEQYSSEEWICYR